MNIKEIEHVLNTPEIIRGAVTINDIPNIKVDMSKLDKNVIWMMTKKGGWSFTPIDLGVYECHFGYTKKGWGKFALEHSKQCIQNMGALGAKALIGGIPENNLLAKSFLKKVGAESVGFKEGPYKFQDKDTRVEVFRWVKW